MACTRGSRGGEPARSQAVRRVSIAPIAAQPWVPASVGHILAVSYTHLDVYKRQSLGIATPHPQQPQAARGLKTMRALPRNGADEVVKGGLHT